MSTTVVFYGADGSIISIGQDTDPLPTGAFGYTPTFPDVGTQIWTESDGITIPATGIAGIWRYPQTDLIAGLASYRLTKETSGVTFHSPSLSADVTVNSDDSSMSHWWSTIFSAQEQTQSQTRSVKCSNGTVVSIPNSEFPLLKKEIDVLTQGSFDAESVVMPSILNNTILTILDASSAFDTAYSALSLTRTYISPTVPDRMTTAEGNITSISGTLTTANASISTLNTFAATKGANSGLAPLDSGGKVPSANLPSYVDDVLDFATKSAFPGTGETGKIYIDDSTNLAWRWSGSTYFAVTDLSGILARLTTLEGKQPETLTGTTDASGNVTISFANTYTTQPKVFTDLVGGGDSTHNISQQITGWTMSGSNYIGVTVNSSKFVTTSVLIGGSIDPDTPVASGVTVNILVFK